MGNRKGGGVGQVEQMTEENHKGMGVKKRGVGRSLTFRTGEQGSEGKKRQERIEDRSVDPPVMWSGGVEA